MNIVEAISDENLFRPFLADSHGSIKTWNGWKAILRCLYGLPVPDSQHDFIRSVTGRMYTSVPRDGFSTLLALTGRRCGKSRMAALCGAAAATICGNTDRLSPGEEGLVAICAPTRDQSRICHGYIKGVFEQSPILRNLIVKDTRSHFLLRSGIRIEILTGDFRSVRGYTLLGAVIDEACFFGVDEDSKVRSDGELIAAIKPALATTGGKLVVISSPYAQRGWCYKTYGQNFGNANGKVLVVNAPSQTLNPTLPTSVIEEALEEDYAKARSEYFGEWRDDVGLFISRGVLEGCIIDGRTELQPDDQHRYVAFADVSGGRSDGSALAIAHRDNGKVVVDKLLHFKAPHNPHLVIGEFARVAREYGITRITGDKYAADFMTAEFQRNGIRYENSDRVKSELYLELLPLITSSTIELPDNELLIKQLCRLERRTRSGGIRDTIDHPSGPNNHDDLANAVAGACVVAVAKKRIAGGANAGKSHSFNRKEFAYVP